MSHLAPIHYKKFEKFLLYISCEFVRQKGDHRIYKKSGLKRPLVVPADSQVPVFVIRNNLRTLGINPQEYLKILEQV